MDFLLREQHKPHTEPNKRYLTYTELLHTETNVHINALEGKLRELAKRNN